MSAREKWGGVKEPALVIVHQACGHELGLKLGCPSCGEPFGPRDAKVTLGESFAAERRARRSR